MGPSKPKISNRRSLYFKLRQISSLSRAWNLVHAKGLKSKSKDTRNDIVAFSRNDRTNLNRIQRQLQRKTFRFSPARGALVSKGAGKSQRPIVIAPVPDRVVQRALLDVIQSVPSIHATLTAGYNFGGISGKEFGVPTAIGKVLQSIPECGFFIRTDIKSFFTAVPRDRALSLVQSQIPDPDLNKLLTDATTVELADLESFGNRAKLFPLWEEGVAQGSSLSPLLCNLLLAPFDEEMNKRNIVCIRYIDDFIILAPNRKSALKAFEYGLDILGELGLSAYDPESNDPDDRTKADQGITSEEFTFLGCDIRPDRVRPTKKKRSELRSEIRAIFVDCLKGFSNPKNALLARDSYASAITRAGDVVRGWGNTYSFCNDERLFKSIDLNLEELFLDFQREFLKRQRGMDPIDRRRINGFFPLTDCNTDDKSGIRELLLDRSNNRSRA